jgi:CysZ protein
VQWLVAAVLMVLGTACAALLGGVVAAPFNDALSEAVERLQRTGAPGDLTFGKVLRDLGRTVGLEAVKLACYGAVMLPLFIASLLLPGAGAVVYSVVGFGLTALFLAIDYVDWPASRRELPLRRRFALARAHVRPKRGRGVGLWVIMLIPLLNLFFMPAAVAGATLMYLDLHDPLKPTD